MPAPLDDVGCNKDSQSLYRKQIHNPTLKGRGMVPVAPSAKRFLEKVEQCEISCQISVRSALPSALDKEWQLASSGSIRSWENL